MLYNYLLSYVLLSEYINPKKLILADEYCFLMVDFRKQAIVSGFAVAMTIKYWSLVQILQRSLTIWYMLGN